VSLRQSASRPRARSTKNTLHPCLEAGQARVLPKRSNRPVTSTETVYMTLRSAGQLRRDGAPGGDARRAGRPSHPAAIIRTMLSAAAPSPPTRATGTYTPDIVTALTYRACGTAGSTPAQLAHRKAVREGWRGTRQVPAETLHGRVPTTHAPH